ncbi:unnamed protein product [Caenorhabditis angaria]|uniref:RNA helicase n=1 Tax=Caenorhabditis angaria TaxID=860376 RepID=A0A9P1MV66_9PELO|nr:unnamed protein product [Caenorhabditis angaria]
MNSQSYYANQQHNWSNGGGGGGFGAPPQQSQMNGYSAPPPTSQPPQQQQQQQQYGRFQNGGASPPQQNGYALPPPHLAAQMFAAQQAGFVPQHFFQPPPPIQQIVEQQNGYSNGNAYLHQNNNFSGYNRGDQTTNPYSWKNQSIASDSVEKSLFNLANSGINFDNYENIPVEVSGDDTPAAIDNFTEANLHEWIQENVAKSGYTKPTPVQKHSIPTLLANRDLMSCAQTGSGKTAAFLLPIINHILTKGPEGLKPPTINNTGRKTFYPSALILSPTRELAIQIHKEASKFSYRTNIITSILYGGRENYRDQVNRLRNGVHILIATPGRLIDIIDQGYIGLQGCQYFVLDEADRMLDMGFEPQIRKIVGLGLPQKDGRTTAMFSATFPKEIQILAKDFLKENYVFLAVGRVGSTSENIEQRLLWVDEMDKKRNLMQIISQEAPGNLISVAIHGDLKQLERERNLECFRSGEYPVLVATAVAARGLDIPNVRHVVNFDLPGDADEYVHRIGRTGRCGNTGMATSFFNDKNRGIGRELLSLVQESNQEIPDWLRRVAAEGRIGGGNQRGGGGNRRFGAVDYRRGGGGFAGHTGGSYMPQNTFIPSGGGNGFGNGFGGGAGMYGGGGGPRRAFPQNGGFGAHNGLSSNGFGGGRGGSRGGFSNMSSSRSNGISSSYTPQNQTPMMNSGSIDHWQN